MESWQIIMILGLILFGLGVSMFLIGLMVNSEYQIFWGGIIGAIGFAMMIVGIILAYMDTKYKILKKLDALDKKIGYMSVTVSSILEEQQAKKKRVKKKKE